MTASLVIIGLGGGAHDILDVVEAINRESPVWDVIGFLDDDREPGSRHLGVEVIGSLSEAGWLTGCLFINAIGSDRTFRSRPGIIARTGLPTDRFATLIHPQAAVSPRAHLARGVLVNAGASVAGNVSVGDQVSIGPGCVIGHDSVIQPFAMLAPRSVVSGFCHVGLASYVGAGAILRQKVVVGSEALVGMGAVVLHDVAARAVVVGNPARVLERAADLG